MHQKVLSHFRKVDPVLHATAIAVGPIEVKKSKTYFADLCDAVISQQLSTKAGATIVGRFFDLFPGRIPTAEKILNIPSEKLRAVGMSNAKVKYIQALATAVKAQQIMLDAIDELSDAEVLVALTKVKGIGPWTAEMFLMFSLGREDVFSAGDLGLRRAIQRVYNLKSEPSPKKLASISKKWSPYRTYASRILWKSLEL